MNKALHLRNRKNLLIKTIKELIDQGFYTDTSLAKELGTYRQKVKQIRTQETNLKPEEIEKYLKIIGIK